MAPLAQDTYLVLVAIFRQLEALTLSRFDDVEFISGHSFIKHKFVFGDMLDREAVNQLHFIVRFQVFEKLNLIEVAQVQATSP